MKHRQALKTLAHRLAAKASSLSLTPVVALLASPVHAALPTMPTPSGGGIGGASVADGDWLGTMGAWFKQGLTMLGLILAAVAFLYVVSGALSRWKAYSAGRSELADLKEFIIVGAVLMVFVIAMVTYATSTLA